jgi:hypothetical protein
VQEGEIVDGRFLLLARHGVGGMGELFRARDLSNGAPVALKALRVGDAERFAREAKTLSRLEDPAIVRYVASSVEGREPYLVMEWLEGEDLAARLSRGRLALGEALVLGERMAAALAAAHAIGVVHRDLKPANVFLPGRDVASAKLLDFGVAWQAEATVATEVGVVLGTIGYMAPEQARGLPGTTPSVDLFALGVVLFEALAGRPPFVGEHPIAVYGKLLMEPAPRLSELDVKVPAALERLIDALLAKTPDARPRDAETVRHALAEIAQGAPDAQQPTRGLGAMERRLASVIFVSTYAGAGGETLSSDDWRRARDLQAVIAARHGATFDVLRGGTSLVTLDGEGSLRAQAVRAARCARELREASEDAFVVLATGRRSVGGASVVGEVIDRCGALLRASDEAGAIEHAREAIRVDDSTAALLRDDFVVGRDALGAFLGLERPPETSAPRSMMLGRERELSLLLATMDECARERVARAVLLVGPAGIGKSRLAREAVARFEETRAIDAVDVWEAAADPACAGAPFSVLARALARAAGVRHLPPREAQEQLHAYVERACATATATGVAELIETGLAILFDLPMPEGARPRTTRAALVREALERLIAERRAGAGESARPLILLLDDVQWCDVPTLRLIDGLLRGFAETPLMVLATARPEIAEAHPRLFAERGLTEVRLPPLSRAAGERLVRARLGQQVDETTLDGLLARADGNPLFLDELARAVQEGRAAGTPSTIASVIELRLRALDDDQRRLLRAASVFGQRFPIAGVRALLGPEARDVPLVSRLDALVARDVLVRDGERPPAFAFAHALFVEAAHAMLTEDDARLGHLLAAGWLAANGAEPMVIARHWELGEERGRALELYERAAEAALEAGEPLTAIGCADHGLRCGAEGERRGALLAIAADAHQHLGELAEARSRGQAALALLGPRSPHWHRASRAAIALNVSMIGGSGNG